MTPRMSVIVRSYNRLGCLVELLGLLLDQDHDSFEVVVVDQTTTPDPDELAAVEKLAEDPRVQLHRYPPLGGPKARNTAVRHSRGEIIVLIDDDDLPATRDWLRRHEANYSDPLCLGVSGRHLDENGEEKGYKNPERARRQVLSFNVLKYQRIFVATDTGKRVESIHGTNASIRRTALERFGLWDECTPIEDEPSFAFRLNAMKEDGEYLLFDPASLIKRRLEVPGGMNKRKLSGLGYGKKTFTFFHNIVGHYFPVRFALLYPIYYLYAAYMISDWIVGDSIVHRSWLAKAGAVTKVWLALPLYWTGWLAKWWYARLKHGPLPHHPTLSKQPPDVASSSDSVPALVVLAQPRDRALGLELEG